MSTTVRKVRMIEQPGHLPPKVAKRPEGVNRNERWARPAPAATIERPGLCPKPRQARREASALWAVATEGGKATRSGAAKP